MSQQYLMAIDAGTGSVRAVIFSLDGEQTGCVQREWEHKEDPRYPGSMDFDWAHNYVLAKPNLKIMLSSLDSSITIRFSPVIPFIFSAFL